jgi:branched-chain amino acid transport system permease protein
MIQILANGLCSASIICLMALGFGMIYSANRVLHVAHAAVFTSAGYVAYLAIAIAHLPMWLSALSAIACAALLGMLIEFGIYGPILKRGASSNVVLISSLGTYIIIVNIVALLFGNDKKILRPGVEETFSLGGVILTHVQFAQLFVAAGVVVCLYCILYWSRYGRLGRAIADNSILASVLGINVPRIRLLVAACGSALGGLAAFMAALDSGIEPNAGFPVVLTAAVACVIGGLGGFMAPALGALIIGLLESLTIWYLSAQWSSAATFLLLILFILIRPQGISGIRRRLAES